MRKSEKRNKSTGELHFKREKSVAEHIALRDFLQKLKDNGIRCTLLGVGPVSEIVTRAAIEACKKYDCPLVLIASRNQVDLRELGHGYLMGGMDQKAFTELVEKMKAEVGYEGPVYVCRDHGGPWQRNKELDEKYPIDKAMKIAKQSYQADIEAGFNYLHIDPTKCPFEFKMSDIIDWTVDLLKFCEDTRKALGKPEIDYEVGTEDIRGGLTAECTFEAFLRDLTTKLENQGLPPPTCVVAQTGTLCKIDRNVGWLNQEQTRQLANIAVKYDVGLKEHNGDYLSAASCRVHPDLGITGVNVAPEFGLVETDALLELEHLEQKLVREGWLKAEDASNLRELLLNLTFETSPWNKWMTKDIKDLSLEQIEVDGALRLLIARVCGHYAYDMPEMLAARKKLYKNIDAYKLIENGAEAFVIRKVRDSIDFYLEHFKCKGVNAYA